MSKNINNITSRIGITGGTGVLGSILNKELKKKNYRVANFKYDIQNINFHRSVIKGYKHLSKNNNRFCILDASKSIESIHQDIIYKFTSF